MPLASAQRRAAHDKEADDVGPRDLLREHVGEDELRDGQELVRDAQAVHVDLRAGVLLAAQHRHRHDEAVAREWKAEELEDEREHRAARDERARKLAEAEGRLELLAERDQVVHLLQQLRAQPAEEARRRQRPPELEAVHGRGRVELDRLRRQQPDLRQAGEGHDHREPRARERRNREVGVLHVLHDRIAASQPQRGGAHRVGLGPSARNSFGSAYARPRDERGCRAAVRRRDRRRQQQHQRSQHHRADREAPLRCGSAASTRSSHLSGDVDTRGGFP
eukprot:1049772-Prymnesium_polylepis.1